jgi:hypothetical protein
MFCALDEPKHERPKQEGDGDSKPILSLFFHVPYRDFL